MAIKTNKNKDFDCIKLRKQTQILIKEDVATEVDRHNDFSIR